MDIHQCEREAKNGAFDSMQFDAHFPSGTKRCQWLDAYFGLFKVEGLDGFVTTDQADEMFPNLRCTIIQDAK